MSKVQHSITDLRQNYQFNILSELDIHKNPFEQFSLWFEVALKSNIREPNAMSIATVSLEGHPSIRTVLLKEYNKAGFIFYTNYKSRKGKELAKNPYIALLFFWDTLERQIRIEGKAQYISSQASDNYFNSRPKPSRIGAVASPQSEIIPNRNILEKNMKLLNEKYSNTTQIKRPEHWGGYIVKPTLFEFWQGRPSRLHDRIQYTLTQTGEWKIDRLAP